MKCPYCTCQDTRVIDSRDSRDYEAVRRRRQCVACGKRFTTYERFERPELKVVKRSGATEDFDRDKLEVGILKACEKRPIARVDIMRVIDDVEEALRASDAPEVDAALIGEIVLERLRGVDDVAYMRYASVYKAFHDASHFERELKTLRQAKLGIPEETTGARGEQAEQRGGRRTR
jgi:transcriptional repressor NrdR